jgi:hypothetical protein
MKKIVLIIVGILVISIAAGFTSHIQWHTLGQIAKSNEDFTSVDMDENGFVDSSDSCNATETCLIQNADITGNLRFVAPRGTPDDAAAIEAVNTLVFEEIMAGIYFARDMNYDDGNIIFKTHAAGLDLSPRMIISSLGDVGIGTEEPRSKLEVKGNDLFPNVEFSLAVGDVSGATDMRFFRIRNNPNRAETIFDFSPSQAGDGGPGTDTIFNLVNPLRFDNPGVNFGENFGPNSGPATFIFMSPSNDIGYATLGVRGSIGIGIDSPIGALHVEDDQGVVVSAPGDDNVLMLNAPARIASNGQLSLRYSLNFPGNPITFSGYHGENMRITDDGNVGISTTAPTEKLHVNGNILASGTITPGADYAEWFEKEGVVEAGDLIGINLETGKARKYQAGDYFIGIYSEDPAYVGNRILDSDEEMKKNYVLVGLLGQLEFDESQVLIRNNIVYTKDNTKVGVLLSNNKVLLR